MNISNIESFVMKLIKWGKKDIHVSEETVKEFEESLQSFPGITSIYHERNLYNKVINKVLLYLYVYKKLYLRRLIPRFYFLNSRFCVLMGEEYEKCMRYFFFSKTNGIYFFDCWPERHRNIENFIKAFGIRTAFFSSERVTQVFSNKFSGIRCEWLPEAINLRGYQFNKYDEKDIDVLQFGRRYDPYHDKIRPFLEVKKRSYLYEKVKGEIVFKDQRAFIEGLARSKISVCFPLSLTQPERAGGISTMTMRYLQSMASKCLIIGSMPDEMHKIFDYIPIVEVDFLDPEAQLLSILENYNSYIPLIEKNYETVKNQHTWEHRCKNMMQILAEN